MFNNIVCGSPVDNTGLPIEVYYNIEFPYKVVITTTLSSYLKQITINTNDSNILGYEGYLENDEPFYINIWQGSFNKSSIIRQTRKRINYAMKNMLLGTLQLNENLILNHKVNIIKYNNIITFNNTTVTNRTVKEYTYYIYGTVNSMVNDNTIDTDYVLIKVIKTLSSSITVSFNKVATYKVISETLVDNYTVSQQQQDDIVIDSCSGNNNSNTTFRLEWD